MQKDSNAALPVSSHVLYLCTLRLLTARPPRWPLFILMGKKMNVASQEPSMTSQGAPELISMPSEHLTGAPTAQGPSRPIFEQLRSMDFRSKRNIFERTPIDSEARRRLQTRAAPHFPPSTLHVDDHVILLTDSSS